MLNFEHFSSQMVFYFGLILTVLEHLIKNTLEQSMFTQICIYFYGIKREAIKHFK